MTENSETITLVEHQKLYREGARGIGDNPWLEKEEFDKFQKYLLAHRDEEGKTPLIAKGEHLKAANYVGAIITEQGTRIEILPKVNLAEGSAEDKQEEERIRIFIEMLYPYLGGHSRIFKKGTWGEERLPFLEEFIKRFLEDVQSIVRHGLARTYIPHEDNIPCLKGKLDFTNHIRYNLFRKDRFYVIFDEFTIDRPVNRVIKRALREVIKITGNQNNRRAASQLLAYFEEVQYPRDWRHEVKISKTDRSVNSTSYESAFEIAKLILSKLSPDNWSDNRDTISLLFPMEMVFEFYVKAKLDELFDKYKTGIKMQPPSHKYKVMKEIDGTEVFTIIPDIVARHNATDKPVRHCIILDTKWKVLDSTTEKQYGKYGISQSDIYQLYSYGKVYKRADKESNKVSITLLYPFSEKFQELKRFTEEDSVMKEEGTNNESEESKDNLLLKVVPVNIKGLTAEDDKEKEVAEKEFLEQCLPENLHYTIKEPKKAA